MGGAARRRRKVNLEGSRNVFEAARRRRRASASSTPRRSPPTASTTTTREPLTEDVAAARHRRRSTTRRRRPSSRRVLADVARRRGRPTPTSSGPCIVAGPDAPLLIDNLPYIAALSERLPGAVLRLLDVRADPQAGAARPRRAVPARPPRRRRDRDARRRARAAATPGVYNLAGRGELTFERPRRRARLVLDPDARARRRRDRRDGRAAAVPAARGAVARRPSARRC